jgi:hypothetical protein
MNVGVLLDIKLYKKTQMAEVYGRIICIQTAMPSARKRNSQKLRHLPIISTVRRVDFGTTEKRPLASRRLKQRELTKLGEQFKIRLKISQRRAEVCFEEND